MPLMKYFGFVGSALVLLLVGTGWFFPEPITEPIRSDTERPAIRISSAEQLPERVVLDTTLPTIAPPSVLEFAERWPREAAKPVEHLSTPAPPAPIAAVLRKQNPAKQERPKKIAAAPKLNVEPAMIEKVPPSPAVTRMTLLDILKEGVEQTHAKLIASLEPLTTHVSKLRPETR
jgi:hypothetical protein